MVGGFLWLSGGVVRWRYVVSVATVGGGGVRGWLVGVLGGVGRWGWCVGSGAVGWLPPGPPPTHPKPKQKT